MPATPPNTHCVQRRAKSFRFQLLVLRSTASCVHATLWNQRVLYLDMWAVPKASKDWEPRAFSASLIANLFDLEWNGCLGAERRRLSLPDRLFPPSDAKTRRRENLANCKWLRRECLGALFKFVWLCLFAGRVIAMFMLFLPLPGGDYRSGDDTELKHN